jgi:hypothetical protein
VFNKRKRLEKKVEHGEGRRAHATILHVTKLLPGSAPIGTGAMGGTFRVKVQVEPAGEPAFEAHVSMHIDTMAHQPREGQRIPVIYSGESVVWDKETDKVEYGRAAAAKHQFKPGEADTFRTTLYRKLDELHRKGKISDAEYAARKAEIAADPELNPPA